MRKSLDAFSKAFAIIAIVLVLAIGAGTAYGLATGSRGRKLQREAALANVPAGSYVFTRLGTLRAATRDKPPAVVVATVSFPYPADDPVFAEELDTKTEALKAAALGFFAKKNAAELLPAYEGAIKAGLRDSINSLLSLGKVDEIWLSDFAVIQ